MDTSASKGAAEVFGMSCADYIVAATVRPTLAPATTFPTTCRRGPQVGCAKLRILVQMAN